MLMTVFILVLIQGLVSSEDQSEVQSCFSILQSHDRGDRNNTLPDSEELLVLCPIIKGFIDCNIRNPSPHHLEEIPQLHAVRSFLDDLCNESSLTFKAYADNFDCFRSMTNDEVSGCSKMAFDVGEEYVQSGYAFQSTQELEEEQQEEQFYSIYAEKFCLMNVYPFLCIGKKMQETCDSGAYDAYVDFITRIRLTDNLCPGTLLKSLKKGYTDFLSNENKTSEIQIFNDILGVNVD